MPRRTIDLRYEETFEFGVLVQRLMECKYPPGQVPRSVIDAAGLRWFSVISTYSIILPYTDLTYNSSWSTSVSSTQAERKSL